MYAQIQFGFSYGNRMATKYTNTNCKACFPLGIIMQTTFIYHGVVRIKCRVLLNLVRPLSRHILLCFVLSFPSLFLSLYAFHIYAKTITRPTHKFMECQRKADRRKNNDIMLTCTHHTRTHTHSCSWAYANDAPDSWAKAAQRWLQPDEPWVAPLTHIYLHISYKCRDNRRWG